MAVTTVGEIVLAIVHSEVAACGWYTNVVSIRHLGNTIGLGRPEAGPQLFALTESCSAQNLDEMKLVYPVVEAVEMPRPFPVDPDEAISNRMADCIFLVPTLITR